MRRIHPALAPSPPFLLSVLLLPACGGSPWPGPMANPKTDSERLVGTWSPSKGAFTVAFTASEYLLDQGDGIRRQDYTTGPGPVPGETLIKVDGKGYRARFEGDRLMMFLPGLDPYTQYALDRHAPSPE